MGPGEIRAVRALEVGAPVRVRTASFDGRRMHRSTYDATFDGISDPLNVFVRKGRHRHCVSIGNVEIIRAAGDPFMPDATPHDGGIR